MATEVSEGVAVADNHERPDGDQEPTTREWIRAILFFVAGAVLVTALLIWIAFTFFFQGCGAVPPCT